MPKSKHGNNHKERVNRRRKSIMDRKKQLRMQMEKFFKEQALKNANSFVDNGNGIIPIKPEGVL